MGIYKNVMELLVEEEVSRQAKSLPARVASYVNQSELVAYALNQLPALYATSEKGLEYQIEKGRVKFAPQIAQSVQRAIAAIRRDPLRTHIPLETQERAPFIEVLDQLRGLLRNDRVDWENLPSVIEQALNRAARGEVSWDSRYAAKDAAKGLHHSPMLHRSSPFPQQPRPESEPRRSEPSKSTGQFGSRANPAGKEDAAKGNASKNNAAKDSASADTFGWDNPLYDSRFPKT
jgi:DNA-binding transcriptional regulator YdaS (Cro superfamily)